MQRAGRIALLEAAVVDQIAAGEVIERPASVVKELLDNALDAGATRVSVDAVEGGRALIRVADDGHGMSGEEALLSLQRHATSKLREAADLTHIQTLGFRGEGLAAVAAVSRLSIETRRDEDDAGWRVSCEGGGAPSRAPAARGRGTTVTVRELFFNTPARLKFLRSKAAETAHITEMCVRIACGYPGVRFTLRHGERVALELPAAADRLGRARAVVGRHGAQLAQARIERDGVAVEACLAAPDAATRTARQLTVLVNGRPVRERRLQQAVANGYGVALRQASYPLGVVYLDIDPHEVDVNVHPQKLEVRFSDEASVLSLIETCVAGLCARQPWSSSAGEGGVRYSVGPSQARALPAPLRARAMRGDSAVGDAALDGDGESSYPPAARAARRESSAQWRAEQAARRFWSQSTAQPPRGADDAHHDEDAPHGDDAPHDDDAHHCDDAHYDEHVRGDLARDDLARGEGALSGGRAIAPRTQVIGAERGQAAAAVGSFRAMRVVGQALGRYLLLEDGASLFVLDVARARRRVALARAEAALSRGEAVPGQRLLIPARIELGPQEIERAVRGQGVFTRLGLELVASEEQPSVWFVRSVPQPLRHVAPEALARTMLDVIGEADKPPAARALLARAVRGASGQREGEVHARALLAALDEAKISPAHEAAHVPLEPAPREDGSGAPGSDPSGDPGGDPDGEPGRDPDGPALFRLVVR